MESFINEVIKQFKVRLKQEFAPFVWLLGKDRSVNVSQDSEAEEPVIANIMPELFYIWFRAALFCALFYFWFAEWVGKLLDIEEATNAYTGIALTLGLALSQTIYLLRARKK